MSVSFDFSGKYVLVTGSTKGIGNQIADEYVKAGANVLISGRKKEAVNKVIDELAAKYKIDLKKNPKRLIATVGDCGTKEGCDAVIDVIKKECPNGHLHVLVNNVGIFEAVPFDKITDDEWLKFFNINVLSGVRLSRYCICKMLEPCENKSDDDSKNNNNNDNANGAPTIDTSDLNIKRRGGNIVFISSECGLKPLANMIHYSMTKTAQISISRGLAQMCKGIPNVRVNCICPGPTFTVGVEACMCTLFVI